MRRLVAGRGGAGGGGGGGGGGENGGVGGGGGGLYRGNMRPAADFTEHSLFNFYIYLYIYLFFARKCFFCCDRFSIR